MSGIYGLSSSYQPLMLSHQTGLSVTASTANTFYAIGNAISVPRSGIAIISMSGHVNGSIGYIQLQLTRGSNTYAYGSTYLSLFIDSISLSNTGITSTSKEPLLSNFFNYSSDNLYGSSLYQLIPVLSGDSLQFYATNGTANDITYVDDVLVMLI
ncbi:MAG: hypothetical protein QXE05_10565 [Nitrososphaeria archaeon]